MSREDIEAGESAAAVKSSVRALLPKLRAAGVEELFEAEPEYAGELLLDLQELAGAQLKLAERLAAYVCGLPPEERGELLAGLADAVDGSAAAALSNQLSVLMMTIGRESPDFAERLYPAVDTVFEEVDFGKLRESAAALLELCADVAMRAVDGTTANPVIIANLVGVLPPVVNSMLKVVAHLLEKVELPAEILASAVFNVLLALKAEEVGRVLSRAAGLVNELHVGNMILGGDEPRLRAVFTAFAQRVLDNTDLEALSGAAAALGEDLEVLSGASLDLISRDPSRVEAVSRVASAAAGTLARVASGILNGIDRWPDEYVEKVCDEVRAGFDAVEAGRAVDGMVALAGRFREARPGLTGEMLTSATHTVDIERLDLVLRGYFSDMLGALKTHPGVKRALEPAEVGGRINDILAAFNRSPATDPPAVREYLAGMMSAIDEAELKMALHKVREGALDLLLAGSERGKALLRSLGRGTWRIVKFVLDLAGGKAFGGRPRRS